ncbi:NUDIX hydrolase [Flagellimonas zhangzhouensis]|uniref:ADP-ribose pyrophosphatase YjhB, NUDIX family n=1 Tax=Flagellimonas zhangzhouensis TaxID=1073328 RepID=A0A1H2QCL9_9FLAO|nr:ADP-ribose pyrophosphatase YjhB, NUDIX family [Allomuricauda zhangzhouensis]SDW04149.1 ADP-ribose pyrophosphatase YjhB, NUDIX family [Allomuricauda zhangzhouensis]
MKTVEDLEVKENLGMHLNYYQKEDQVLLAVDCIIFGFEKERLKILLIKRNFEPEKGKWSLIGGFLKKNEDLDQAADRVLETLTGLNDVYLEQLHTYSKIDRDPGQRTISVAYFALIDVDSHRFDGIQIDAAHWFDIKDAPDLIFDHNEMVRKAKARLRRRALTKPIGFELLPEKFTMRQLQNLYESILDKKLDKRNFINKINSLDILVKLDEKDMSVSRKGAYLYIFDKEKYEKKVQEDGFSFKI